MTRAAVGVGLAAALTGAASTAPAQPLGTFRWQLQPHCNVIVVNVVQNGAMFNLNGVDDQCGAGTQASVVGMAFPNRDGSIGLGLTIVTAPGGTALHLDATISLPSASGTWRDSTGTTGAFTLTPGTPAPGSPRPIPRPTFPGGVSLGGATISGLGAPAAATDAANRAYVDGVAAMKANAADVGAALLGQKVWKGRITSSGFKQTSGPYTTSRAAEGVYQIRFDVSGLRLPANGQFPVVAITASGPGNTANVTGLIADSSGGFLTRLGAVVSTFNSSGAATDVPTAVWLTLPDPDVLVPLGTLDRPQLPPGATCTMVGDTTSCIWRVGEH